MLKPRRISPSHRDAFLERYQGLHAWAIQMTGGDKALAEDLLHDLFILFTLSQPDLNRIRNLDNYLYASLRNLHISQIRRATRGRFEQLSVVEYESARLSLRSAAHGRDLIQAQDELRRICHYACARKETAKAASVLILRFFHGYYPSEIAMLMRATRQVVDVRLRDARREANVYLVDPKALAVIGAPGEPSPPEVLPARFARNADDFLVELQQLIFRSRQGECLNREVIEDLYRSDRETIERGVLAHLVSCHVCLDAVNSVLSLPLLVERYPTDTMDKDNKRGGGPPDDGDKGGGIQKSVKKWEREARETFEHKPQELCVSVNGYLLGSQLIGSELSELTLNVTADERINFCEVFSEQGVRLMMMNVEDLPPSGPGELRQQIELSEARTLESALLFSNPFPTLHVTYHDPSLAVEAVTDTEVTESAEIAASSTPQKKRIRRLRLSAATKSVDKPILALTKAVRDRLFNLHFWLRPATVTGIFALILIGVLAVLYRRTATPPVSAADLLNRASVAEDLIAARTDQVLHRTINFEERASSGALIAQRKIDVWHSAEKGITARRLYDDNGQLVAGDWRRADGVQTLYAHGKPPQLQLSPEKRGTNAVIAFDTVWQFSLSAKEFTARVGRADGMRLEEDATSYVISYSREGSSSPGLVRAVLVLSRADLHPTEQSLVIQQGNEQREFRFIETSYEKRPSRAVTPSIFEPAELLSLAKPDARNPTPETASPLALIPSPVIATLETEVEVVKLLDSINAFSGEQISVQRTTNGQLKISGIVDSVQRKTEVLNALSPVWIGRGVFVEIETLEEAANRRNRTVIASNQAIESVNVDTRQSYPVEPELRALLAKRGVTADRVDDEMRSIANAVAASSRALRRNALALKQIAERFTPAEVERLEPVKREEWKALVRSRARAVAGDVRALTSHLTPIFPGLQVSGGGGADVKDDAAPAAQRLFGLAAACDSQVNQSFAITSGGKGATPVKSVQFWRSLAQMADLAAELQRF